ncbi:MAG: TlpA family protein disulfide reductase [Xanthomonadaceae bacterium]|nr:TlpA family protein disulfide reductase [Xanthomonadaceae bacterium]
MNPMLSAVLALSIPLAACSADAPPTGGDAASASSTASVPAAAPTEPAKDAVDMERPALKIATLDGAQYDLAAKRGRWIVVNFWATWCSPCLKEMPELDALDAEREDIEVIGLAYEEIEPADLRAFLDKRPVKYPIAIVDVYDPPADFPTPRGLPMTHVIAPDGTVAKRFMGPVTKDELAAVVDGKAVDGVKTPAAGAM